MEFFAFILYDKEVRLLIPYTITISYYEERYVNDNRKVKSRYYEQMTKVIKQESEWRAQLSELAFEVTRNAATEKPFLEHNFPNTQGLFHCICCNSELFSSSSK